MPRGRGPAEGGGAWLRLTRSPPWPAHRHGEARSRGGAAGDCGPSTPSCAGSEGTRCALTCQSCIGGSRLRGSPHSMAATSSGHRPLPCCSPSRTPAKCSSAGTCPGPAPRLSYSASGPEHLPGPDHLNPSVLARDTPAPSNQQSGRQLCPLAGCPRPSQWQSAAVPSTLLGIRRGAGLHGTTVGGRREWGNASELGFEG